MGAYVEESDLKKRLGDDFAALYDIPSERDDLEADIAAVEAEVNAHLGRRYVVPVTNATAVAFLRALSLALLEEAAWQRGIGDTIPAKATARADRVRDLLAQIAAGKLTVGGATGLTEQTQGGAEAILVAGNDPEFERDDLEGY